MALFSAEAELPNPAPAAGVTPDLPVKTEWPPAEKLVSVVSSALHCSSQLDSVECGFHDIISFYAPQ